MRVLLTTIALTLSLLSSIVYADVRINPFTGRLDIVGDSSGSGSGSTALIVQEGDSTVVVSADTMDFAANDFIVTSSPSTEANIAIDYTNGQAASASTKGFLTAADFISFSSGGSAAGSNNAVQFESNQLLAGDSGFTYNATNDTVKIVSGVQLGSDPDFSITRSAAGQITFAAINETNNETLTLNLETTSNQATIGTTSGVGTVSFTSLSIRANDNNHAFGPTNGVNSLIGILYNRQSGSSSSTLEAGRFQIQNTNTGGAFGLNVQADRSGAGISTDLSLIGLTGHGFFSGSGTQAHVHGVRGLCSNTGSATVTNCYSIFGSAPINSGGGTLSNAYAGGFDDTVILKSANANGLVFTSAIGTAPDTNLYRSAVDNLKTDDSFTVGTNLTIGTLTGYLKGTTGLVSAVAVPIPMTDGGTGNVAATDDTVMIGNGGGWAVTAIPNCTDSGGNHLNYTTATNALSCGTSSSGSGSTSPGGSNNAVQFESGGAFAGDSGFTYNATNDTVTLAGTISIDGTPNSNQTGNGTNTNTFLAGTTITVMDTIYMGADGKWLLTDADFAASSDSVIAIALESKTLNQAINVALPNTFVKNTSWSWSPPNATVYLSTTAGALTTTQPSGTDDVIKVIGHAVTTDTIYFDPEPGYMTHI